MKSTDTLPIDEAASGQFGLHAVARWLGLVVMTRREYDRQIMLAGINGIEAERRVRVLETDALRRQLKKYEQDEPCYICGSKPGMPTAAKSICSRCGNAT